MLQEEKNKKTDISEKIKTLFNKIKNFNQLKEEVFEMKNTFQKTNEEVNTIKSGYSTINKKVQSIDKYFEGMSFENIESDFQFKNLMKQKIDDHDEKFNFLLGDFDINENDNDSDNNEIGKDKNKKSRKKKIFNFIDVNKRLNYYQHSKVNVSDFELKNSEYKNSMNKLEKKLNDIISNLYGNNTDDINNNEENTNTKNFLFATKNEFEKYKTKTDKEIDKIWEKINYLNKQYQELFNKIKEDNCTINDLDQMKNLILEKTQELFMNLKSKDKDKDNLAIKTLQKNFKKLLELLAEKEENEKNWLITKKPMGGFICGSCEKYIGDLKSYTDRTVHWKKMPVRIKENDTGNEILKIGNGYSRLLNMIDFDKDGIPELNPFDNMNDYINSSINVNENSKSKDKDDLSKSGNNPRIRSTTSKYFIKEKIENNNSKTRNKLDKMEKKLPNIMVSNSVENFEKIRNKLNTSMSCFNFFSTRMRKNHIKKLYKYD